jgi:hypothetical protein
MNWKADRMSDNPMDKLPAHNRVSIRAVLVHEGEDASAALAEAGFSDAIAIPVMLGDQPDVAGGILGNGITANLIAVLETEQDDDASGSSPNIQPDTARSGQGDVRPSGAGTTMLPEAFGMQPLAPVRGNGQAGHGVGAEDERHDDRAITDSSPAGSHRLKRRPAKIVTRIPLDNSDGTTVNRS